MTSNLVPAPASIFMNHKRHPLKKSNLLVKGNRLILLVRIERMRGALGAVEPFDMAQSSADLRLLDLLLGLLALLLGLELERSGVILDRTIDSTIRGTASCGTGDGAGYTTSHAAARTAILEAIKQDGCITLHRHPSIVDVPLLAREGADKLFVV